MYVVRRYSGEYITIGNRIVVQVRISRPRLDPDTGEEIGPRQVVVAIDAPDDVSIKRGLPTREKVSGKQEARLESCDEAKEAKDKGC